VGIPSLFFLSWVSVSLFPFWSKSDFFFFWRKSDFFLKKSDHAATHDFTRQIGLNDQYHRGVRPRTQRCSRAVHEPKRLIYGQIAKNGEIAWCVVNMFHENGMRPLIIANGTICCSILYCNSPRLYIRLKYLYPVISVKLDWLPGNSKKWTID